MLKNMKIRTKLLSGFIIVALITGVVGWVGYNGLITVKQYQDKTAGVFLPSIQSLLTMSEAQSAIDGSENALLAVGSTKESRDNAFKRFDEALKRADDALKIYEPLEQSKDEEEAWKDFKPAWEKWLEKHNEFAKLAKDYWDNPTNEKYTKMSEFGLVTIAPYFSEAERLLNKIVDINIKNSKNGENLAVSSASSVTLLLIIFIAIGISVALIIGIFLSISMSKAINIAVNAADKISDGNLDVNLDSNSNDEIGSLLKSMKKMKESINNLIIDTNNLSQAAIAGELDKRADAGKYKGEYKNLIQGINSTLDAVIGPLNVAAEYVDRISKGDIPPKIVDEYKGDFNEIKMNLNQCIDSLNLMSGSLVKLISEQKEGDLESRCNNQGLQGVYMELIKGINDSLDIVINPVVEAIGILNEYAQGDLSKEMRKLQGKQILLTNCLNNIRSNIKSLITDIQKLAQSAINGNLSYKIDITNHKGDYQRIVEEINNTLEAIIDPINEAAKVLEIMSTGDLTARVTGSYRGDHEKLKESINSVSNSLNNLLKEVTEAVQSTASASMQISSTSETMAAGAAEQSAQADEVATAVEQMSRTITQNAMSATKTAETAEKNGQIAKEGETVVEQTVSKMRDIAQVVKKSADNIEMLGASSQQIGEIISVIDDIADQTNLLALNAAIEAARAGDQGRGFAVVADEVRKLAERTTEATKQIATMIKGIQKETVEAVEVMQKGNEEVSNGISLADRAGKSLNEIVKSSLDVQSMIAQIAAASEEQSSTSEQIARNVQTISSVSAESARNIQDIASSSNDLSRLTEQLTNLMSQFTIDLSTNGSRGKYKTNGKNGSGSAYSTTIQHEVNNYETINN